MTSKLRLNELGIFLKHNQPVSTQQLLQFYQTFEPDLKVTCISGAPSYDLIKNQQITYFLKGDH